ncbi:hypothetical protein DFJ73DRAFT_551351 [Zopfochytrium polystomum]|nr:hypothetical protein DFJ73DRAFT_551351 [Zopfochytrium polystomum]
MGRSEFAAPYVSIQLASHAVGIVCNPATCSCGVSVTDRPRTAVIDLHDANGRTAKPDPPKDSPNQDVSAPTASPPVRSFEELLLRSGDGSPDDTADYAPPRHSPALPPRSARDPADGGAGAISQSDPGAVGEAVGEAAGASLTGIVTLRGITKGESDVPGTPDLEILFLGREHVDVYSREGAVPSTTPLVAVRKRIPWRPRDDPAEPVSYLFDLTLPAWLPPSSAAKWGAVDYRIIARFLVPEDERDHSGTKKRNNAIEKELPIEHAVVVGEFGAQKTVPVYRTHGNCGIGKQTISPITRTIDGAKSFGVQLTAPEYAQTTSGSLKVNVKLSSSGSIPLSLVKKVRVYVAEIWSYSHQRLKDGRAEETNKIDMVTLGEASKLSPPAEFDVVVPFESRQGLDGVPVVVHPRLNSVKMGVMHQIVVEVHYFDGSSAASGASTGHGLFKGLKSIIPQSSGGKVKTEMVGFPILLVVGPIPARIGK